MGWNGSGKRESDGGATRCPAKKTSNGVARGLVAGLIIVAGVAVCWLLFMGRESPVVVEDEDAGGGGLIGEVTPAAAPTNRTEAATNTTPAFKLREYVHNGIRSSNRPPASTNDAHYASQMGVKVVGEDGIAREVRYESPFKTPVNRMVWAAIRPGGMPSGLRALRMRMQHQTGNDEAFMTSLKAADISIEADDAPEVRDMKERTIAMKEDLVKALEAGEDFNDAIREIEEVVSKERLTQRVSELELQQLIREGNVEEIRKYVKAQNEILRERGLRELRMPSFAAEGVESGAGTTANE